MKPIAAIVVLPAILVSGMALAMTRLDAPGTANGAGSASASQVQVRQSGKLGTVYAAASKLVISGVTYAYNPLTTIVMIKGKRSTISDLHSGETVQFQSVSQGPYKPALLTSLSVQR